MKVALYCRESDDDATKAPPIEKQIERGQQWAKEKGFDIINIYSDDGFSGGNWNRPAWLQSLNDAKRHTYQILWVWNQDRLARDTEQFLYFYRNITEAKVKIYEDTSNEFIEMETLGNRVKHQTMAQAAEIFRLVTSEKVKQAYRRKKLSGGSWGRNKKEFDLEEARRLRNDGGSWRSIGKALGVGHNTIRRAFQNSLIVEQPIKQGASPLKDNMGIVEQND